MSDQSKVWVALLEVVATLTIVAGAAVIAVPKYADERRGDQAIRVLADVDVVRTAVYAFYSDSAYFPAETPGEAIPDNLSAYLPSGFSSFRPYGTIAYKNWPMPSFLRDTTASTVIGATVTTRDPRIGAKAAALSPATAQFTVGNKYVFVLFGS